MEQPYSDPAVAAFIVIPILLVMALLWGVAAAWRRSGRSDGARAVSLTAAAAVCWMAATWIAADSGVLRRWDAQPPPFGLLVLAITSLSVAIAFTPFGARLAQFLPIWALVGIQGFRLPLEVAMHTMFERGVMPEQMTYTGRNWDILTGITALIVVALVLSGRGGRLIVALWNILGLALVLNVVIVAILATPRLRYFGDDSLNVWVTYTPFVWLPAVMVLAAFAGHLLIFRALRFQRTIGERPPSRRSAPEFTP